MGIDYREFLCENRSSRRVPSDQTRGYVHSSALDIPCFLRTDAMRTELRDSTFHRWLLSTRQSVELKKRLTARLEQQRSITLDNTFGHWRERRLRKLELQVKAKVDRGTRAAVLERWQAETTVCLHRSDQIEDS